MGIYSTIAFQLGQSFPHQRYNFRFDLLEVHFSSKQLKDDLYERTAKKFLESTTEALTEHNPIENIRCQYDEGGCSR